MLPRANNVYGHERLAALGQTWYVHDALGNVHPTLDSAGAVQATATYASFGEPQGSTIAPWGFTGKLQDQGLVNLRARWYDPRSGVFTGVDPFSGFPQTPYALHPYQYGHGNPIRNGDPSGYVCTGIGSIDAATGCNGAVADAVNAVIVCGPKPASNNVLGPRYWCNSTTHQWEAISMGTVIVAPGTGVVQGARRVGDLLRACAAALAAAAGASLSDVNVDTQTREDQQPAYLYHYTRVERVPAIIATGLRPSIQVPGAPQSDAQWGDGQYLTDLTPTESSTVTRFQHSAALFQTPWMWGGTDTIDIGWIKIDVRDLPIQRVAPLFGQRFPGRSIYLNPSTVHLPLANRVAGTGSTAFQPSQSGVR